MLISEIVKKIEYDAKRLCADWASLSEVEQRAIKLYIIVGSIKAVSDFIGMTYWILFRTLKDKAGDVRYYKQKLPRKYPSAMIIAAADLALAGSTEAEIIEKTGADAGLLSLIFGAYMNRIEKDDSNRETHAPMVDESGADMLQILQSWRVRIAEKTTYYNQPAYYVLLPYRWSVRCQFALGRSVIFDDKNKMMASWSRYDFSQPARIY